MLTYGCYTLVPKAQETMQQFGVRRNAETKQRRMRGELVRAVISFRPESYSRSVDQAAASRDDRRVVCVLDVVADSGGTAAAVR